MVTRPVQGPYMSIGSKNPNMFVGSTTRNMFAASFRARLREDVREAAHSRHGNVMDLFEPMIMFQVCELRSMFRVFEPMNMFWVNLNSD